MRISEDTYRVGFEQLGHVAFDSWLDMAKVAPDMIRLGSYRTVHGLVARHVKDERLRFALSFHPLFVGGNPFSVTSIYALIAFLERAFPDDRWRTATPEGARRQRHPRRARWPVGHRRHVCGRFGRRDG